MITRIRLTNFMCHQDTTVELGPLTVLIGPNDSGKTSFLRGIELLSQITNKRVGVDFLDQLIWRKARGTKITWEVEGNGELSFRYTCVFPREKGHMAESLTIGDQVVFQGEVGASVNYPHPSGSISTPIQPAYTALSELREFESSRGTAGPVSRAANALSSSPIYSFSPRDMRSLSQANDRDSALAKSGSNLASVVSALLRGPDRDLVNAFEMKLHETIPTLRAVSTPVVDSTRFALEFALADKSKPPVTIPADQVSDGALYVTAFLALAYGETPGILLIDEPETGLHPSNLRFIIDVLSKMSRGEVGQVPRQVILTTHSPLLLNYVEPSEIRIFQRKQGGPTQVKRMDQVPNIANYKEFAPGELWYLFGEDELVKGPAA